MNRLLWVIVLFPGAVLAHEGHEPLPTKGITVRGDRLALSPSAAKAIGLTTSKVELADVSRTVRAAASIELPWNQQAYVTTLAPGRVEEVLVKPGETVVAGQELARLSSVELEKLQLEMLEASLERALASRLLTQQRSAGDGIAARVVWQTQSEMAQHSARFNIARQKLRSMGMGEEALQQVLKTGETARTISITSPIEGVVAMADTRPGEIIAPTQPIYHLVDPRKAWAVARVLEADARQMRPGLPVLVTFAMLPNRQFRAAIHHVELYLNSDRTLSVKALLDNNEGVLKPGMFGSAEILVASSKEVVCPTTALVREGLAYYAFAEEPGGYFLRRPVAVRSVRGPRAEIEDGLFPGDVVVAVGSQELASLFPPRSIPSTPSSDYVPAGITAQGLVEIPQDQKSFASAPIEGRIRRILVEHGQPVRRGDLLAELESLPFETLQLDLLEALAGLAQVNQMYERFRSSNQSDFIAEKEMWKLAARRDLLQQRVASLRRTLALLGLSDAEIAAIERIDITGPNIDLPDVLPIRAPADGLIAEFDLVPGQVVPLHEKLFVLHNASRVWVRAFLFEQDAVRVRLGQVVHVRLASDPGFRAQGKVERLEPRLVSGNRLVAVWTELDNRDLQMREGMAALVTIESSATIPVARK